tara:strand:+ start:556 stop:1302 length:747 start_codon:yes stop_codon:yes gene_type:complete
MSKQKSKEVVKKVKKKPGRKPKKKVYFGMEVQDAIVRYNQSENNSERNNIYQKEIHAAFDKLCENIINTFKFTYFDDCFEDVKAEVVSFLVMNIHKYDHTKGSKAFSYFSIVAKNYLILHNNNNYKKYKTHVNSNILNSKEVSSNNSKLYSEFTDEIIEYFDDNIPSLFRTKRDINIAFSIIELMKQRDDIENFNKKAIYILIREMTNVETAHITKVINVFKKEYKKLIDQFSQYGTINHIGGKTFFK